MADHLSEQTLPVDKAEMAAYYQRGMAKAFAGRLGEDALALEASEIIRAGIPPKDVPEALEAAIIARHAEFVESFLAGDAQGATHETAHTRLAEFVVAGGMAPSEAEEGLVSGSAERVFELHHMLAQAEAANLLEVIDDAKDWQSELKTLEAGQDETLAGFNKVLGAASYRWDKIIQTVEAGVHGHTAAEPRRDMNPKLAELLGIDVLRPPTRDEIANLLNGQRADGEDIPRKQTQQATAGLDAALGLAPKRAPTELEASRIISGLRADGKPVEGPGTKTARSRFMELMGVGGGREPTAEQQAHLLAGRMADGSEIDLRAYERGVTASKARIGYVDLTMSADKSASIAWALAPTEAERNIIAQAHRDAISTTMEYIAGELGHATKGKGGSGGTEPGDIAWFEFTHYASRPTVEIARTDDKGQSYTELLTVKAAGDMQLHTHVATLNVVLTGTGRVGAIDLDKLDGRVHEFGAFYQANMATNLRRHGVDVVLDEKTGAARLTAIPEHVRDAFSKRTRDGTQAAREYAKDIGLNWDELSPERKVGLLKEGTQKHKLAKTEGMTADAREKFEDAARKDDVGDFASWNRQAAVLNYSHRSVLRPDEVQPVATREQRLEHAYQTSIKLLDHLLQRRAKVTGEDLRVVAARGLVAAGVETSADIGAVTRAFAKRGVEQNGQTTSLIWGDDVSIRGKERVGVTTALHVDQEQELSMLLRKAAGDRSGALTAEALGRAVAGREALPLEDGGLRFSGAHGEAQRAIIDTLGQGGRFAVAVGVAGAGKSALLAPLVDAWKEDGRSVHGAALAWRQTEDLEAAGIERRYRAAVDVFIKQVQDKRLPLDARSVVVIDEVGLIGTRQMLALARLQAEHGFQMVAVGDPKQGQAIEAGSVVNLLRKALGDDAVPELLGTTRQQTERERETSLMFREGRAGEALAAKQEDSTAQIVPGGHREAVARVASLWRERTEANAGDASYSLSVTAPSNSDARAIAAAIREQRRDMGQLGPDLVSIQAQDQTGAAYALPLAVGDRVRLFARATASFKGGTHGNIGNNGSVLEVLAIDAKGMTLRNGGGREGHVKWDTLRDGISTRIRLAHGDVLTIDAAQGLTSTEHIAAMPGGTKAVDAFKGYVASSRHRRSTWLVTSDGAERQEVAARRPLGDPRLIREADVWENMARNLSRQPEKSGAMDFLDRAKNVKRGAVRSFQEGLQPGELRQAEGKSKTTLRETFAAGRTDRRLKHGARTAERQRSGLASSFRTRLADGMDRVKPALEVAYRAAQQAREQIARQAHKQSERVRHRFRH